MRTRAKRARDISNLLLPCWQPRRRCFASNERVISSPPPPTFANTHFRGLSIVVPPWTARSCSTCLALRVIAFEIAIVRSVKGLGSISFFGGDRPIVSERKEDTSVSASRRSMPSFSLMEVSRTFYNWKISLFLSLFFICSLREHSVTFLSLFRIAGRLCSRNVKTSSFYSGFPTDVATEIY